MRALWTSLAFLSRLPIPGSWQMTDPEDLMRLPRYFWLAGLILGGLNALALLLLSLVFPPALVAVLMVGVVTSTAGAFHEDGFADVADAFGGYTVERRLEILRDSRLGTFGVSALAFLFLMRFTGYSYFLETSPFKLACFLLLVGGWMRWTAILLLQLAPYVHPVGKGVGRNMCPAGWPVIAISAMVLGGLTLFVSPIWLVGLLLAQGLVAAIAFPLFLRVFGGVNGDCLGTAAISSELLSILCLSVLS